MNLTCGGLSVQATERKCAAAAAPELTRPVCGRTRGALGARPAIVVFLLQRAIDFFDAEQCRGFHAYEPGRGSCE